MKRITAHREQRGWSRAELARRAGLHPSQVGQIEAGRFIPYPSQLSRLAAALGLSETDAAGLLEEANREPVAA